MPGLIYLRDWHWEPPDDLDSIEFRCAVPHPILDAPTVSIAGRVSLYPLGFTRLHLESAEPLSARDIASIPWSTSVLKNAMDDARDRSWGDLKAASA